MQRLHQLTSVPALAFDSLNDCLHSNQVDEDNHVANVAIHQMGVAVHALALDDKFCLSIPALFVANQNIPLQIALSSKTLPKFQLPMEERHLQLLA